MSSDDVITTREEVLPLIKVVVAAAATRTISFPDEFFGTAKDIRLTNLDGAANASFRIGGDSQPTLQLLPSALLPFGGIGVKLLTITAAAGGAVQVEATIEQIVSR